MICEKIDERVFEGQILCHMPTLKYWKNSCWAKIIYDNNMGFGIRWIKASSKYWTVGATVFGINVCGLSSFYFDETWITTDDPKCPPCPFEEIDPPNNQNRKYCFWHKYTETRSVKALNKTISYCPICER